MKNSLTRVLSVCALSFLIVFCSSCSKQTVDNSANEAEPSISWRADTTGKYLNDEKVNSVITVRCTKGHDASVKMFEKSKINGKTVWTETLECDAYIGREGLGKTKEGDYKTPIGDFGIVQAFGIKPNPGTKLPYIDVTDSTYACCDEEHYNQIIDMNECPHEQEEDEHMIEYSPEYNYGFSIDYNKECEVGKGNSIFFHCMGANTFTAGCIAVSEENMVKMLKVADKNTRIIIDYLPE